MKISNDSDAMKLALEWAASVMFSTTPNPRVGCVIVKNGALLGAGATRSVGGHHAEVQALNDAKTRGHDVRGATAYVTLEPCNHYGRTPPCSKALVQAGISRVVAALEDPNPLVAGQGMATLAAAGMAVSTGLLAAEAHEMNIGFFSRMQRGRPWVRLKTAASLDGMTALHNGQSQWITGSEARADGHAWRARACAILTGIGTVKADDPQLTVRLHPSPRQPRRIIVDSHLDISPQARILEGASAWIVCAVRDAEKEARLRARGAEIIHLPNAAGKVDLVQLMLELGRREINELHVEAGVRLNGSLIREGCVDELLLYLAPALLGDAQGMFALPALAQLDQKYALKFHSVKQIGADVRILARFNTV